MADLTPEAIADTIADTIAAACARVCEGRETTTSDPVRAAEAASCASAIRAGAWRTLLAPGTAGAASDLRYPPVTPEL
jgi:hypothetical protein